MIHYCPVCLKEIPEDAYGNTYSGCIQMYGLDKKGFTATGKGTIRLGEKAGEFESVYPKEIFTEWFDALRNLQGKNSVRVAKCH